MKARSLLTALCLAIPVLLNAQQKQTTDIVSRLLPNPSNPHRVEQVSPSDRDTVVKQLRAAQAHGTGERLQQTAFLLALLNSDYEKNRDYLTHTLRGCTTETIRYGCDVDTGAFLMVLFERGHQDALQPLMLYGTNSYNAALAELVGDFLATTLSKHSTDFLNVLRHFPSTTQTKVCGFAGAGDGGGMAPTDLQRVRTLLKKQEDSVALRCLKAVEKSNRTEH
jgi:hypothetical protein